MGKTNTTGGACEFVRSTRIEERLRILPEPGHTGDEILSMLNNGQAEVFGEELVVKPEPGSAMDGFVVLGKVLRHERPVHPKSWKKLGTSKTQRRASADDAVAVTSCGHSGADPVPDAAVKSCPTIGSPEHLRFQADQLRYRAEILLQQPDGCELSAVAGLLHAARGLLEGGGGLSTVEGVWLIAAEALLADKRGQYGEAARLLERALRVSDSYVGHDHPSTIGIAGNYGQYLVERGEWGGKVILEATLFRLEKCRPNGNFTQTWLDGARNEFGATLTNADQIIRAWLNRRRPVADAVCDVVNGAEVPAEADIELAEACYSEDGSCNVSAEPAATTNESPLTSAGGPGLIENNAAAVKAETAAPSTGLAEGCCEGGSCTAGNTPEPPTRRQAPQRRGKRVEGYKRHPGSDWLETNWSTLPADQWCAANGDGLVAYASTNDELMEKLKVLQVDPSSVAIAYNETGTIC